MQVESTLAMQNLQPKLKAIQERYKGNQVRGTLVVVVSFKCWFGVIVAMFAHLWFLVVIGNYGFSIICYSGVLALGKNTT